MADLSPFLNNRAVKSVQRGSLSNQSGNGFITISAVDLNKSILIVNGYAPDGFRMELLQADVINYEFDGGFRGSIYWQVIEEYKKY